MRGRMRSLVGILMVAALLSITGGCGKKQNVKGGSAAGGPTPGSPPSEAESIGELSLDTQELEGGGLYGGSEGTLFEPIRQDGDAGKTRIAELLTIYFDFDSDDILTDQQTVLDSNAQYLFENADFAVEIQGHCDERGTPEYNLALGERRALAVRAYLIQSGVDASRLYTISYGAEVPAVNARTLEAFAMNRRAEFWMIQK